MFFNSYCGGTWDASTCAQPLLEIFSVFLFGAVFVSVVIGIVSETLGFLKLLK